MERDSQSETSTKKIMKAVERPRRKTTRVGYYRR